MQLFVRDKQFYKTTVKIAVPIVLQSMITIGVNMMDTFMVGKLGEVQLSATSLANEFINIFHIMCMGMGYGAAVLTAQYWGAKDIPSLKKITAIMLRICLVLATLFMVLTLAAPEWIMKLYTKDTAIIAEGEKYFTISAFTYLLLGLSLTLTAIMRSVREVKLPLITSIIAFFVNIFFKFFLVF